MRIFDIDNKIMQIRKICLNLSQLDISDRYSDVNIGLILSEIYETCETIDDECLSNRSIRKISKNDIKIAHLSYKSSVVHKIEQRMSKNLFYGKYIRPRLKILFPNMNSKVSVQIKDLLKYEDAEFVDVVYRNLLFREADMEGKRQNINLLRSRLANKVDIINSVLTSPEGRQKYIKVNGMPWHLFKHKMKNGLNSIPLLSYPIRWIADLILLPIKQKAANQAIFMNMSLYYQMNDTIDSLAKKVEQLENDKDLFTESIKNSIAELSPKIEKNLIDTKLMNKLYFDYKNKLLNNDRQVIKKKLTPYIGSIDKWLNNREKMDVSIVDLGCGLGEWIEILNDYGYSALGIDSNDLTVIEAKRIRKNITIECDDVFSFLGKQNDNSIDILSSFHMIEHLELKELFTLFDECKRVLKPQGLLILVTPNPQNLIIATYLFHLDPTHKNPIPVELLKFYLEEWGLHIFDTIFLNPYKFFDHDLKANDPMRHIAYRFNMEQEYCVMAVKI